MKRPALVSFVLFAAACGPNEAQVSGGEAPGLEVASARLEAPEASITFRGDWNIARSGLFIEGGVARVAYDASRLPQCRGEQNGEPAWSITGYAQVNDGPVQRFEAGGYSPSGGTEEPVVRLPEAGRVAFWFQVTNRWGCSAWDSNFGRNFVFEVGPQPRIVFDAAWNETVVGMPGAAPGLVIEYDLQRLPSCRAGYNGYPTWEVLVFWRFDGGEVRYTPVTKVVGAVRVEAPAVIEVPKGAGELELWFNNTDRGGCVRYDSDYGRNYRWRVN